MFRTIFIFSFLTRIVIFKNWSNLLVHFMLNPLIPKLSLVIRYLPSTGRLNCYGAERTFSIAAMFASSGNDVKV